MSGQPTYCPKCGAQNIAGAAFCSKCGASLTGATVPPTSQGPYWGREHRHEKSEKGEKQREKGEKPEKGRGDLTGPVIGGGVLILLGILVYLQSISWISGNSFGGIFLMGIGVLLILGGIIGKTTRGRPWVGYATGGLVLIVLGSFVLAGFNGNYAGAIFLVLLGFVVIFLAYNARRRSPPPTGPAPT